MIGDQLSDERDRLVGAVPAAAQEVGFRGLRAADIAWRAGVSQAAFYEHFRDEADCFLASYRHHTDRLTVVVESALACEEGWADGTRAALAALLRFLAEDPDVAHMAVVEVLAGGPGALAERDRVLQRLAALIGNQALSRARDPALRLLGRTAAGSVLALISTWIMAERTEQLEQLLPTCMYIVLVAPLGRAGAAAACEVLESTPVPG